MFVLHCHLDTVFLSPQFKLSAVEERLLRLGVLHALEVGDIPELDFRVVRDGRDDVATHGPWARRHRECDSAANSFFNVVAQRSSRSHEATEKLSFDDARRRGSRR